MPGTPTDPFSDPPVPPALVPPELEPPELEPPEPSSEDDPPLSLPLPSSPADPPAATFVVAPLVTPFDPLPPAEVSSAVAPSFPAVVLAVAGAVAEVPAIVVLVTVVVGGGVVVEFVPPCALVPLSW